MLNKLIKLFKSTIERKRVVQIVEGVAGAASNAATSGAVVVPVTETYSGYSTNATADIAATLADGEYNGQIKVIKCEAHTTNNLVVTPANLAEGSTLTFDAAGEVAVLIWVGTTWRIVYNTSTLA